MMNHFVYILAKFYPFWAVPLAVIVVQLGIFFRRKNSGIQYYCWALAISLILAALVWLIFRGDLNSDGWIKRWEG